MQVQALSLGYALDADAAARGVVHSVFRHAVNVIVRGEMWTLLAEAKSDLPFGIRTSAPDFEVFGLRGGEPVHVRAGFVGIGSRLLVDGRVAARWEPSCENEVAPGLMRRVAVLAKAVRGKSWGGSAEMARAVKSAMHAPAMLGTVLAKIVGRGPGATPSGDDVLVGILAVLFSVQSGSACGTASAGATAGELVDRASAVRASSRPEGEWKLAGGVSHRIDTPMRSAPAGAVEIAATTFRRPCRGLSGFAGGSGGLRHRLISVGPPGHSGDRPDPIGAARASAAESFRRALLPLLPTTNDLSAHLLRQAARGQLSRDLHELVSALIGNPSPEQLADAVRRVVETGATSGADTCEGLLAFAPSYFTQQHEMAAA